MISLRLEAAARARQLAEHLLALGDRPPAAPRPRPAIDYPRLQHRLRWFEGVLELYRAVARAVAERIVPASDDDLRTGDDSDRLVALMGRAHRILLEHPVAAKAAFAALVAEGRAFAATPDGAALGARLARSPRLRRGSLLWRSLTMGMLDTEDPGVLPATYLDNLLRAIDRGDLETLLGKLQLRAGGR